MSTQKFVVVESALEGAWASVTKMNYQLTPIKIVDCPSFSIQEVCGQPQIKKLPNGQLIDR